MITLQEAKELQHGDVVYHAHNTNSDGTPQRWRVVGRVKTWKRDPNRIEVPIKCGLYTWDTLTFDDLGDFCLDEDTAIAEGYPDSLEGLKLQAFKACEWRGHEMKRWKSLTAHGRKGVRSECKVCGKTVVVLTNPAPNETNIMGAAVAVGCED